jgi:hypothetical protein
VRKRKWWRSWRAPNSLALMGLRTQRPLLQILDFAIKALCNSNLMLFDGFGPWDTFSVDLALLEPYHK